jgi:hypothetical protein
MRAVILAVVCGLALAATPLQAAPVPTKATPVQLGAAPPAELVRDGCGRGWHRHHWRDQWGYWRWGDCAPDEGRPYGGYGAGTYYPPPVWRSAPAPWGWGW